MSVQWKKFGIILNFTPTVIADGALHLKLMAEVSDVDAARSVTIGGFSIPGLTSRQSETTVRLSDGQSFAIAGLLSDRVRSQIQRIPFLGDLPILGALFRSVSYQRDESELLVVVTAHLAQAGGAARRSPPADRERAERSERHSAVPVRQRGRGRAGDGHAEETKESHLDSGTLSRRSGAGPPARPSEPRTKRRARLHSLIS